MQQQVKPHYITHAPAYFDTFIDSIKDIQTDKIINIGISPPKGFTGIIYNTEQLSIKNHINNMKNIAKNQVEIWDYSLANVKILEENGIAAKHVPLKTSADYIQKLSSFYKKHPPKYDIGFSGSISDRRKVIIDRLKAEGFSVLSCNMWGLARDEELAKCRVIINIHFNTDYKIFESARCEPWIALGIPVISEDSLDNDPRCIVTPYNDFVATVKKVFEKN